MKSMSQLAVLSRRWRPSEMKLDSFQEVVLESSSVEELKEKVKCASFLWFPRALLMSSVGKQRDVIATKILLCGDYFFFPGTENLSHPITQAI